MAMLEVKNVTRFFGGLAALTDVSFEVQKGGILGLIGPNGAGKTTLFNVVNGFYPPSRGEVVFQGKTISGLKPHQICRLGMARTFQVYVASGDLTVEENVMVGCFMHTQSRTKAREKARDILKELKLHTLSESRVKELPVSAQKRVIMATALGTKPKLLLLDEVAAGLNPSEIEEIMTSIRHVHDKLGVTVMLIEHVMELVMKVSARVIVLDYGKLIADGSPEQVSRDRRVIKAYLGERFAAELEPETWENGTDRHG